jgi:putative transposase
MNREFDFRRGKFRWQGGYGAFSVSESAVPSVTRYIERQREQHRSRTFEDEFREILHMAGLDPANLPGRKQP